LNGVNQRSVEPIAYAIKEGKMSKKLDPRVIRTRKMLRDALMALIIERDFETITVRDITEHATLNHATFYLHYRNKEELLEKTLEEMFDELKASIPSPSMEGAREIDTPLQSTIVMFQHIAANAMFYRVMLGAKGTPAFAAQIRNYLADNIQQRMESLVQQHSIQPNVAPEFIAQFTAGAYLGILIWWLEHDCAESVEMLATQFIQTIAFGNYRALGIDLPN
jgi:AcrR family transcriptional regulator